MKRRSKILIGVVVALGIGWLLMLMISHKNVRDKVAAYKQELRAKGEKLTIGEIAPPTSTKKPNGAVAFTNMSNFFTSSVDSLPTMLMIASGIARIGHTNIGAELMFSYASNVQRTATLRAIITNAAVLDFNLDYSKEFAIPLPHLAKLKAAEIVVTATAMQALYQKDYSEAWPDICAAADLIRLFDNEPIMISGLVRAAMVRIAIPATWEALQDDHWTDSQLANLQAKWEDVDLFKMGELTFGMERAGGIDYLAEARKSYGQIFDLQAALSAGSPAPNSSAIASGWVDDARQKMKEWYDRYPRYWRWKSSWSYEEELCYLQIETACLDASRSIKTTGAFVPAIREFRSRTADVNKLYPDADRHFFLGVASDGIYEKYFIKLAEAETARRLLITAVALKRYHLQHGAYPTSLIELVPNYLKQVPMDFMDSKPLRYRPRPDGDFLLYSVGEDGEDNGGDPSPVGRGTLVNWPAGRDAVWPRAATPAVMADYYSRSGNETNAPAK